MKVIDLNGIWKFAYTAGGDISVEAIPPEPEFCARMTVPGYWDDNLDTLKLTKAWSRGVCFNPDFRQIEYPLGTGKPADASLPYLIGTGWYKKEIWIAQEEALKAVLEVGEAVTEVAVFINQQLAGIHKNPMTGIHLEISDFLKYGEWNEILLAVSNTKRDIISTLYRGFKGFSAGIYGNVALHCADRCVIRDVYVYPDPGMKALNFHVSLDHKGHEALTLRWAVKDEKDDTVCQGDLKADKQDISFSCTSAGLIHWSVKTAALYQAEILVYAGATLCDRKIQTFGYRLPEIRGMEILLNGEPILLRGLTEHAYFPLTCTAPLEKTFYRKIVKRYREIGFNWIRFHTTVPPEAYLEACDELGMLVQVEVPNGFHDYMWGEVLRKCRKHPCVILYCGGNEERLTDDLITRLEHAARLQKELVPDALFSPMQALPYVDWILEEEDVGLALNPIPHNPVKLEWLQRFSDVFQPQKDIGFNRLESDWRDLEPIIDFYRRPYTSHEVAICDSYINLDLEKRYEGTRIGTDLYAGARENLKRAGVLEQAQVYYRNSCLWSAAIRKVYIEKLRLCKNVSGYDYLGAIDCHWHRTGYTPGILNEFHEYKEGESREDILRYNGENVILLDIPVRRNLSCGGQAEYQAFASVYGVENIDDAVVTWRLLMEDGTCWLAGRSFVGTVATHQKTSLGSIRIQIPEVDKAEKCTLHITMDSSTCYLENQYNVWVYPLKEPKKNEVILLKETDKNIFERIRQGAAVLILNPMGLKTVPLSFTKMLAGRTVGNTATVIHDHPAVEKFPHDGWCDFQFYSMMEQGRAVVFDDDMPLKFRPIVEVVSSYKTIFKQAAVFEFGIGKGKALVCTLNLDGDDPAQKTFLCLLLEYMNSSRFQPEQIISRAEAERMFDGLGMMDLDYSQETGLDGNAVIAAESRGGIR